MDWLILLGALAAAHFIADYPLQSGYLVQEKLEGSWLALVAHSTIAGFCAAVALALVDAPDGMLIVGFAVTALGHGIIDRAKVEHRIDLAQDQLLHFLVIIWIWVPMVEFTL